jgi:hypothetical protein
MKLWVLLVHNVEGGDALQTQRVFRVEREMLGSAKLWLQQQQLLIKQEFYTPWGVCDLLGVVLCENRVRQRLSLGQRNPIGPPRRIAILNRIPDFDSRQSISKKRLAREFTGVVSETELEGEINRLIEAGFVQPTPSGQFQKLNGWFPLHERIVALELKLERVEEALQQAVSHFKFVSESYVGLPDPVASRVFNGKRLAQFLAYGVGLVAVGLDRCDVLLPSGLAPVSPDTVLQMHCAERFWRTYITNR